jgi:hypothetical protein
MSIWLSQFLSDIRFGVRFLAKSPALALIAILSLALGIMATTAIYSVVRAVVLDPFPYKDIDSLLTPVTQAPLSWWIRTSRDW